MSLTSDIESMAGISARSDHYAELLAEPPSPSLGYVELISENHAGRGGRPLRLAERMAERARVLLHGVSMSIGGVDDLNLDHLRAIRELARVTQAELVSDHLCFAGYDGHYGHDLWPLPRTNECLEHLVRRVERVQDVLARSIALENPSSYVEFSRAEFTEAELLNELCRRTGAGILLDVNNVYVSAFNLGFSAEEYIRSLEPKHVVQYHLAGHTDRTSYLFDDHASEVGSGVWELYELALQHIGARPTIVERDENLPSLGSLRDEAALADARMRRRSAAKELSHAG